MQHSVWLFVADTPSIDHLPTELSGKSSVILTARPGTVERQPCYHVRINFLNTLLHRFRRRP
jgi:hypothetical protein